MGKPFERKQKSLLIWGIIWLILFFPVGIIILAVRTAQAKKQSSDSHSAGATYKRYIDKFGPEKLKDDFPLNDKSIVFKKRIKEFRDGGGNYTIIDTETTGLSYADDRLIDIALIKVRGGEISETFTSLINPGRPIPEIASKINGIHDSDVKDAPTFDRIAENVLDFIGSDLIIGYNVTFDLCFLQHALPAGAQPREINYCDVLKMARKALPDLANHKLITVARHYGIAESQSHRALGDAEMTKDVFDKLISELEKVL